MIRRGRLLFIFTSLAVVAVMVGGSLLAATARRDDGSDSQYKYLSMFVEVIDLVRRAYVDETDMSVLMDGALEGVTDALGPYAMYVPASALERYQTAQEIGTARSGLLVLKERGVAFVAGVVPGSPADEAGLERGDLISVLGDRSSREIPLWEIEAILAGEPGTEITMRRIRMGEQEDVRFELGTFEARGVRTTVERGVAVIDPDTIGPSTARDLALSLETLAGPADALPELELRDTIVLDLRNLAGGDAEAAYDVAALFMAGNLGALVTRGEVVETFTRDQAERFDGEVVVLVDAGTQGAAEIVAAVLQSAERARIVGQPSFGHSGRESLVAMSNGDRLRVTTAYFTGTDLEPLNESLEPDIRVRSRAFNLETDEAKHDAILERALEVARGEDEAAEERKAA